MPKVKVPRKSTSIDMTPMVDMAFLLVTFFILTIQFRPDEPVQITLPSSKIDTTLVPERNVMTISVSDSGKVFFNLDNKEFRRNLLSGMGQAHSQSFTPDELNTFSLSGMFGMPINQVKAYLDMAPEDRKKFPQTGIPVDTALSKGNELADWITYARIANPSAIIAIKGDRKSDYTVVKAVMKTLQDKELTHFYLVTNSSSDAGKKTSSPKTTAQ